MSEKSAVVTGGAKGIGAAIAEKLAAAGYHVYINYLRSAETAEGLYRKLTGAGFRVSLLPGDVSDAQAVASMADTVKRNGHIPDVLVNNAGIALQELIQCTSEEQMHLSRAFLPDMINRKSGCIINISSVWGECGASCEAAYSASKAAVIGLTKAMAKELGPSGIRVNCITPGVIDTDMTKGFPQDVMDGLAEDTPLGRIGSPTDIANAVLFLASPESSFITGQILGVNGGFLI